MAKAPGLRRSSFVVRPFSVFLALGFLATPAQSRVSTSSKIITHRCAAATKSYLAADPAHSLTENHTVGSLDSLGRFYPPL